MFGIYVHIPFCVHRCWYCDFNAYAGLDHLAPEYMRALAVDAALGLSAVEPVELRPTVTSVFFGGGTPSRVDAPDLIAVLNAIRDHWPMSADAEITVECNPESATPAKLAAYRHAGINRLSFGVQSFDARLLHSLGRAHDAPGAKRAIRDAFAAGFDDVNLDLIFAVPGESDDTWRDSLAQAIELGTTHISAYGLTYEPGTPMDEWRKLGRVVPVEEDDAARRYEIAHETLEAAGFERYEISNWSRGRPCRHNQLYWACGQYLGIGAGAHSYLGRTRSWTVKPPASYTTQVLAGSRPVAGSEPIDDATHAGEVLFLGLRRVEGVSREHFVAQTGRDLEDVLASRLDAHIRHGLVADDGRAIKLTDRGMLLANAVLSDVLALDPIEC